MKTQKNTTLNRREFIKNVSLITGGITLFASAPQVLLGMVRAGTFDFKISLAQWSLHKAFFSGQFSVPQFPEIAKTKFGIDAVEYVNQFFKDKARDRSFLKEVKDRADTNGVKNLLIMVDQEGPLASSDTQKRNEAVVNHYKWVETAAFLGCHSIRVNLDGEGNLAEWQKAATEGLSKLAVFGRQHGVNIIVENHGGHSSDAQSLAQVIKTVNDEYCGTLPDFGNFCIRREKGDKWKSDCVVYFDKYKGVEFLLPYAKGVSAKTFDFDEDGNETSINYKQMMTLVKDSGFNGYVGIEYEGERLSEEEGIRATKSLLERIRHELR